LSWDPNYGDGVRDISAVAA